MADETTTNTSTQGSSDSTLGEGGVKALQAERARADAAEKRAKELEALLASSKTKHEQQLAGMQTQIDDGVKQINTLTIERDRANVARSKNVPDDLVDYIKGSTPEDMAASADTLMAHVAKATTPSKPAPDPLQGARGSEGGGSTAEQFASFVQGISE